MGKSRYVCQECGSPAAQWMGKCSGCGSWNTLVEEMEEDAGPKGQRGAAAEQSIQNILKSRNKKRSTVTTVQAVQADSSVRWSTGMTELDRVLGGGAVEGAFVLIGGDPGIGKSTLLLQALEQLSKKKKVLYVTGEESVEQVKLRAERLHLKGEKVLLAAETAFEKIMQLVESEQPDVLAIDSIQTMYMSSIQSAPGSVSQVREVGARFMHLAKSAGILVILVGHVTKDGSIAGPRVLEHMVDTVLYFEGGNNHAYRILRCVKNRFGSTNEIGIFEMTELGLEEVKNASAMFLAERPQGAAGSVAVSSMEGSRPLLVELQALVTKSFLAVPRRTVLGVDPQRSALLLAVMEKKLDMQLYDRDIFVNVVGGLSLDETSVDLGIIASVASSFFNRAVENDILFVGEVGLAGEVRGVTRLEDRLKEAETLGFKKCFVPKTNAAALKNKGKIEIIPITKVQEMINLLFR